MIRPPPFGSYAKVASVPLSLQLTCWLPQVDPDGLELVSAYMQPLGVVVMTSTSPLLATASDGTEKTLTWLSAVTFHRFQVELPSAFVMYCSAPVVWFTQVVTI